MKKRGRKPKSRVNMKDDARYNRIVTIVILCTIIIMFSIGYATTRIDGVVKREKVTVFFQAFFNDTYEHYPNRVVRSNSSSSFVFVLPREFAAISRIELLCIPAFSNSSASIDLISRYGTFGENFAKHTETNMVATFNLTENEFNLIDISSVFSKIRFNDVCSIRIDHNQVGGDVHYLGVLLTYE